MRRLTISLIFLAKMGQGRVSFPRRIPLQICGYSPDLKRRSTPAAADRAEDPRALMRTGVARDKDSTI
jgi:hypothetical protein